MPSCCPILRWNPLCLLQTYQSFVLKYQLVLLNLQSPWISSLILFPTQICEFPFKQERSLRGPQTDYCSLCPLTHKWEGSQWYLIQWVGCLALGTYAWFIWKCYLSHDEIHIYLKGLKQIQIHLLYVWENLKACFEAKIWLDL